MLLDRDRLDQDINAGRDPRLSASKGNIELIFQERRERHRASDRTGERLPDSVTWESGRERSPA